MSEVEEEDKADVVDAIEFQEIGRKYSKKNLWTQEMNLKQ